MKSATKTTNSIHSDFAISNCNQRKQQQQSTADDNQLYNDKNEKLFHCFNKKTQLNSRQYNETGVRSTSGSRVNESPL